jgi:hypothetical protein
MARLAPLVAALLLTPALLVFQPSAASTEADPAGWWDRNWHYRVAFSVGPGDFELLNYPVELELDFTRLMAGSGGPGGAFSPDSIRIIRYDGTGPGATPVLQPDGTLFVPMLFDPGPSFDPVAQAAGTVTFAMNGTIPPGELRHYQLYFDMGRGHAPPAYDTTHLESLYWMSRGQVFYGFNPGVEGFYGDIEALHVVGLHNGTAVSVYDITGGKHALLGSGSLELGGLFTQKIPDGTYFSVESDKPVAASIDDCRNMSAAGPYPSRDGGVAGTDFWFRPQNIPGQRFYIEPLENCTLTIESAGVRVFSGALETGFGTWMDLPAGDILHFASTGRIMILQTAINSFSAIPGLDGAPVGKNYSPVFKFWDWESPTCSSFSISAYEDCLVTAHLCGDAPFSINRTMSSGDHWYHSWDTSALNGTNMAFRIESTGNISVIAGGNEMSAQIEGMGDDITFAGGQRARIFNLYALHNPPPAPQDPQYADGAPSGIVFSFFDGNRVVVDGEPATLGAGRYLTLAEGRHQVASDRPVSVMVLGRGMDGTDRHRWNDWGTYLAGRLRSPPTTVGKAEHFGERFGVELLPGPLENEAAPGVLLHNADPGAPSVFRAALRNAGNMDDAYTLEAGGAPAGWTFSTDAPGATGTRKPAEILNFSATLTPPAGALADEWAEIVIHARSPASGASANLTLRCVVNATHFVRLWCNGTVKYADPGASAVFDLSLRNEGNAPDNVTFSATNEGGEMWPFDLSKEEAALGAGREASLNLTVRCPPRTRALCETAVRVTARSLSNLSMTSTVATLTICNLVRGIGFSAEPLQRSVRPGREAVFNLTLSPLGNSVEQLAVRVLGAPVGWEAHVTATRFSLDMNETAAFRLLVVPANDAPPGKTRLSAVATGSSGARANVTVVVEVLETSPGDRITLGENCLVVAALMAVLAAAAVAALEWGRRRRLSS